ncbi:MAG: hypothetical protein IJH67_11255 [Thermoguttaceae bacterium]|nr:hypothetical protein [Thermoguttaceae bacterium]
MFVTLNFAITSLMVLFTYAVNLVYALKMVQFILEFIGGCLVYALGYFWIVFVQENVLEFLNGEPVSDGYHAFNLLLSFVISFICCLWVGYKVRKG